MNLKKKQCSGTKGYSCGRSCISVKKVCRKDGLAGQSVKILNNLVKEIDSNKQAPKPTRSVEWGDKPKSRMHEIFVTLGEAKYVTKLAEQGFDKMTPVTDQEYKAIRKYAGAYSREMRLADAEVTSEPKLQADIDALNNFIDTYDFKMERQIYHGFSPDMVSIYQVEKLKPGSTFSFPSITSTTLEEDISVGFNGAGVFVISNKKHGAPIAPLSEYPSEQEILINKKAKYKVTNIDSTSFESPRYYLEEVYD